MDPPPVRTIAGMACLQVSIWLRRLTAMVRSKTSIDSSVTRVSRERKSESVRAALLCRMSSRPKRSTAAPMAATTSASSDRSARTDGGAPGVLDLAGHPATAPASSMSTTSTEAPSRARARAVARADAPGPAGDDGHLALDTTHGHASWPEVRAAVDWVRGMAILSGTATARR